MPKICVLYTVYTLHRAVNIDHMFHDITPNDDIIVGRSLVFKKIPSVGWNLNSGSTEPRSPS